MIVFKEYFFVFSPCPQYFLNNGSLSYVPGFDIEDETGESTLLLTTDISVEFGKNFFIDFIEIGMHTHFSRACN